MTRYELGLKLRAIGVPEGMYTLSGGLPVDKLCICPEGGKWVVYFSERGSKYDLKVFDTESEACKYFYDELKAYGEPGDGER